MKNKHWTFEHKKINKNDKGVPIARQVEVGFPGGYS